MGTVIFPDAPLKVFLTASAAQRAERRHKQLISKGISDYTSTIFAPTWRRATRGIRIARVAPLKPAEDALLLDNSSLTIEQSVDQVLQWWNERSAFDRSDRGTCIKAVRTAQPAFSARSAPAGGCSTQPATPVA